MPKLSNSNDCGASVIHQRSALKQVDAFEQIYQFATQDRADLVVEFEPMRKPIHQAADEFRDRQKQADSAQRQAVIDLAALAWRRPLADAEIDPLKNMPPRLMLVRVLTSPAFLYRSETPAAQTGPVHDWELATRLSYFLWSSLPDDELRSVAASGKLRVPKSWPLKHVACSRTIESAGSRPSSVANTCMFGMSPRWMRRANATSQPSSRCEKPCRKRSLGFSSTSSRTIAAL